MKRLRVPELMDDPSLPEADHRDALEGLRRLNKISSSTSILWNVLTKIASEYNRSDNHRAEGYRPLRVLDLATGSGDLLVELARLSDSAQEPQNRFDFTGLDISQTAVNIAQQNARQAGTAVQFQKADIMHDRISSGFDIVMTSLFTHHLDPDGIEVLFRKVYESDAKVFIVNDLVRSTLSFALVWLASRIVTRSHVVHFDGPVSVRAAYTPHELREMAAAAGLSNCSTELHPPCRQLLIWRRP
ncbi:MAG TPA: methyltransferase domain-containing protein [Oculatellaceae cyanobacterium]